MSPNKSHDSGYSDSEEGGRHWREDTLEGGLCLLEGGGYYLEDMNEIDIIKHNLRQLEKDYLIFERERLNIFGLGEGEDEGGGGEEGDCFWERQGSIRELFKTEQKLKCLQNQTREEDDGEEKRDREKEEKEDKEKEKEGKETNYIEDKEKEDEEQWEENKEGKDEYVEDEGDKNKQLNLPDVIIRKQYHLTFFM